MAVDKRISELTYMGPHELSSGDILVVTDVSGSASKAITIGNTGFATSKEVGELVSTTIPNSEGAVEDYHLGVRDSKTFFGNPNTVEDFPVSIGMTKAKEMLFGVGTSLGTIHIRDGEEVNTPNSGANLIVEDDGNIAGLQFLSLQDNVIYFGDDVANNSGRITYKHTDDTLNLIANNVTAAKFSELAQSLYYSGSVKFETTSYGASVTGDLTLSDTVVTITMSDSDNGGSGYVRSFNGDLILGADESAEKASSKVRIYVDGNEYWRFTNQGYFGAGTTAPEAVVHASGTDNSLIKLSNTGSGNARIIATTASYAWNFGLNESTGAFTFYYGTGGTTNVSFNSDGSLELLGDHLTLSTSKTPTSATDTGATGEICWDNDYIYVCVATNTWKRTALSTW